MTSNHDFAQSSGENSGKDNSFSNAVNSLLNIEGYPTDKQAMKLLKEAVKDKKTLNHPLIPLYAVVEPRYEDKTTNGLTKCVIDFLNSVGCQAERISSEGKVIDKRETVSNVIGQSVSIGNIKRVKSVGQLGTADISATIHGRSVKIEIKKGNDRQSEAQKAYQKSIEDAGGVYLIVRSFLEFIAWFKHYIETNVKE
jgi:hypothetical protein